MNAPFTDSRRRVVLPRTGTGCRGLLIPRAVVVLDGVRQLVTPQQYKDLGGHTEAHCPCGTEVIFTGAHPVRGSFDMPDHFKTKAGHTHPTECGYHKRKAARDFERGNHEYDLTKPYRIHLNFLESEVRHSSLTEGSGFFYSRDKNGFPVNETHKDWQPISISSMQDLVTFLEKSDTDRLKKSLVILNQQAIRWSEFCISNDTLKRWAHLFNQVSHDHRFLRLFMLQKSKAEQLSLFEKPTYIPRDQAKFEQNERDVILRPCLRTSLETVELASREGVVLALAVPEKKQRISIRSTDRTLIADLPIPAQNPSLVAYLPDLPRKAAASPSP